MVPGVVFTRSCRQERMDPGRSGQKHRAWRAPLRAAAVAALVLLLAIIPPAAAATYTVSSSGGNFTGIAEAVLQARPGDTIMVASGLYPETVRIDKALTLIGTDTGGGLPTIEPDTRGNAVEITSSNCTFANFLIRNARLLSGIRVMSDNNTVSGVTVSSCSQGILLLRANNNVLANNNITANTRSGVALESSGWNRIENNSIMKNSIGATIDEYSPQNRIVLNNFANTVNVVAKSPNSLWATDGTFRYVYLSVDKTGRLGNYWSDYSGKDTNGDGVGDTAYVIQIGANRKAVLPVNQNTADEAPLMDPKEYYRLVREVPLKPPAAVSITMAVTTAAPAPAGTTGGAEGTAGSSRLLPLRVMGRESPLLSALLIFLAVAAIAAGALAYLYRRSTGAGGQPPAQGSRPVAAVYAVTGIATAVLTVAFMTTLASVPPSSLSVAMAWMLCVLSAALSVSALFLARAAWQGQPYPALATLHGIFATLAVPFFALLMLLVPEQREAGLFLLVACLAVMAAIPFWQQRQAAGGPLPDTGAGPAEPAPPAAPEAPAEEKAPDTVVSPDTTTPGEPGAAAPAPAARESYFPRELEGKYTGISVIGRGGIAYVYGANRKSDGKKVAIKIPISFDEMTGKCFLNEIQAWETLRHRNIVEVYGVNILPVPYVEMEFVPGSLEAVAKPLPVWKAVYIVRGIADALSYAHAHGIIHRDIKPHNILVTEDLTPKITDWGMSKVLATDARKSSIAGFSLSYAAPEQVSPAEYGRTDVRTDIYQLGVLFYELVTGSIPFGGESIVAVGNAILRESPAPPSEYNPDAAVLDRIILRCLEKDPARRYQSAAELLTALSGYLDEDEEP